MPKIDSFHFYENVFVFAHNIHLSLSLTRLFRTVTADKDAVNKPCHNAYILLLLILSSSAVSHHTSKQRGANEGKKRKTRTNSLTLTITTKTITATATAKLSWLLLAGLSSSSPPSIFLNQPPYFFAVFVVLNLLFFRLCPPASRVYQTIWEKYKHNQVLFDKLRTTSSKRTTLHEGPFILNRFFGWLFVRPVPIVFNSQIRLKLLIVAAAGIK